jgi:hypothetical protein
MWRNQLIQEFRHGTIVCSCGYRTLRCDCCPDTINFRPNICLSCQTAMTSPNVIRKAIEALTAEANRLYHSDQLLWPNDPNNHVAGFRISPREFLDDRDKHALLVRTGCDWFYWARRTDVAFWRELDNWQEWRLDGQEDCYDCKASIQFGYISFPLGILLCLSCKEALNRAKEAQCRKTESSSGP